MQSLVERYRAGLPHQVDYTALLEETNIFGKGKHLVPDAGAKRRLATLFLEAEARLDLEMAIRCLTEGRLCSPEEMKVSCELEYWAFFQTANFSRVLYVGCGAYPLIALYVLERDRRISFDGIDIIPHATVLCAQVVAKLGHSDRFRPFTRDALEFEGDLIERYDAFFISSAVRPKNAILDRFLKHKKPHARIYAREDEAHPDFYDPVEISHPHLLTARQARARWKEEKGKAYPLPKGCETDI